MSLRQAAALAVVVGVVVGTIGAALDWSTWLVGVVSAAAGLVVGLDVVKSLSKET